MTVRSNIGFAKRLSYSTAIVALMAMGTPGAQAQEAQTAQLDLEQIIVTGSRIVRDGFEAPTPVSVLSADDLNVISTPNIADAVNRLPALQGSVTPTNAGSTVSSGTGGVNQLNLRALQAVRTLVLLDGKRIVGATLAGFDNNGSTPDINGFPGGLVSRVDVVTGGASAVYGSDALAGVVNFVLDKEYTGIKGDIQGGITTYGDDENYKISISAGTPFAGGRGHFLFFGEHTYSAGIKGDGDRPWNAQKRSSAVMGNPAYVPGNGQPQWIVSGPFGLANATAGGLITSDDVNGSASPFRGIQFLAGGKQAPFEFGPSAGLFMFGGDSAQTNIAMWPTFDLQVQRDNFFTRLSYDVTDNANIYTELSWANTHARNESLVPTFEFGMRAQVDNAFLPENLRTQMLAQGIQFLNIGSFLGYGPRQYRLDAENNNPLDIKADNGRIQRRYVAGVEGTFDAMESPWTYELYFARSTTHNATRAPDNLMSRGSTSPFDMAIDSVIDPATGATVCRSTLTNPGNGCIPFNMFGTDVNGPAEYDYVTGTGYAMTILSQDVFAVDFTGEPLSTWAGPVSIAFGAEHRIEKVRGLASDDDINRRFFAGNYIPTDGKWSVTEGFIEAVIPLANDQEWAETLDLNAAVRGADYSESGFITTWKAGLTYTPQSDFTFRLTQSRDIRAPNLGDLFNAGRAGTGNVFDPFKGGQATTIVSADVGNPNLKPEKANSTGLGVIFSPSFVPGLTTSLDYYRIKIKGAITILDNQDVLDRCFAGITVLCASIERNPPLPGETLGDISFMAVQPQNVLSQLTDGIDFEIAYNFPADTLFDAWSGDFAFRGLANYVFTLDTTDTNPVTGITSTIEGAGVNAPGAGSGLGNGLATPHFRWTSSLTYTVDRFSGTLTWRGTGAGVYNNRWVVCETGCPASTPDAITANKNDIEAVHYFDAALNYDILDGNATMYLVAQNLLNRNPPQIGAPNRTGWYSGQGVDEYDRIGRMWRAGVRFSY